MSVALALMLMSGSDFGLDPAWKPLADPYAEGRAGKIQCQMPDIAARTCGVMTWYRPGAKGTLEAQQIGAIDDALRLAGEMRLTLTRDGAGWCGVIDEQFRASARIVSNRAPFGPKANQRYLVVFQDKMVDALWKRKVCALGFAQAGDPLLLEVTTVNGEFAGEAMSLYVWITPGTGWTLKVPD